VSTRLLSRAHDVLVVAPPGLGGADTRSSEAPHGWIPVQPPVLWRLVHRADVLSLQIVRAVAPTITRRRFLRRAGGVILLGSLSLSQLGRSEAHEPLEEGCGPMSAGCGPSPLCSNGHCRSDGECDLSDSMVRRRVNQFDNHWPGYDCGADAMHNCWQECCGVPTDCKLKRCCDCCTPSTDTPACTGCANDRHACICRAVIGTCISSKC
jgi:hypothetical protein